jgi:murein DD-endopeptidase MepM/ murein hydrolase activator NlpD
LKNRLIISITDIHETKSYNFSDAIKKIVKYSIISIVLVMVMGFLSIVFLTNSLNELEEKKDNLISKLNILNTKNKTLSKNIITKAQELEHLNTKIIDIEKIVGITPYDKNDTEFDSRIDIARLTYVDKQYMLQVIPSGYPIPKKGVSSNYGWRQHPVLEKRDFHPGIDLRAKMKTKVRTPADGIVKYAGFNAKGYGNIVIVSHNFGFETLYAHLYKTKVKIGDIIRKGDLIALTGNSGLSSGPHLHYEVRYAQRNINPAWFLRWTIKNYDELFKKQRKIKWQSLIAQIKKQTEPLKQR